MSTITKDAQIEEYEMQYLSEIFKENKRTFMSLSQYDPKANTMGIFTGKLEQNSQKELIKHLSVMCQKSEKPVSKLGDWLSDDFCKKLRISRENLLSDVKVPGSLEKLLNSMKNCNLATVSKFHSRKKSTNLDVRRCNRITLQQGYEKLKYLFQKAFDDSIGKHNVRERERSYLIHPSHYDILYYEQGGKFEFHRDRELSWPFGKDFQREDESPLRRSTEDGWEMYSCVYCIDSDIDSIASDGNTEIVLPIQGFGALEKFSDNSEDSTPDNHTLASRKGMIHRFSETIEPGKFLLFPSRALHRSLPIIQKKYKLALKFDVWIFDHPLQRNNLTSRLFAEQFEFGGPRGRMACGDEFDHWSYSTEHKTTELSGNPINQGLCLADYFPLGLHLNASSCGYLATNVNKYWTPIFTGESLKDPVNVAISICKKENFGVHACTCKLCRARLNDINFAIKILTKLIEPKFTVVEDLIHLIAEFAVGTLDITGPVCICNKKPFVSPLHFVNQDKDYYKDLLTSKTIEFRADGSRTVSEHSDCEINICIDTCICSCPACMLRPSCKRIVPPENPQYDTDFYESYSEDDFDCNSNGSSY